MIKTVTALAVWALSCVIAPAQEPPAPIIDMHLHAVPADSQGPPPLYLCVPLTVFPAADSGSAWADTFLSWLKNPACAHPLRSPMSDRDVMEQTLAIMRQRNVIAVTSGSLVDQWQKAGGDRIIPGLYFEFGPDVPSVEQVQKLFQAGRFQVFGEVTIQLQGIEPSDTKFEPYLALAEKMDIPVGIHIGPGVLGAPYLGMSDYRARLHSPLGLEKALVHHPGLRLYIMHAGWPMLDDTLAMMWTYPQLYIDVGVISFILPRPAFYHYLRSIVEAGFGNRVLFGSDQMIWPDALELAIESIEAADFLRPEQKRDIFYNNAARFLRLDKQLIQHHQGK